MTEPSAANLAALAAVMTMRSAWSALEACAFLHESRLPLRLSTVDAGGYPHVTSLWFDFVDGRFLCATQHKAMVARHVRRRPQVGFEVAVSTPPYKGLSGQADAAIVDEDAGALLEVLTARYLEGRDPRLRRWLLSRIASEVVIELRPKRVTSWDFGRRMSTADGSDG